VHFTPKAKIKRITLQLLCSLNKLRISDVGDTNEVQSSCTQLYVGCRRKALSYISDKAEIKQQTLLIFDRLKKIGREKKQC
jgi:hypothetical protein